MAALEELNAAAVEHANEQIASVVNTNVFLLLGDSGQRWFRSCLELAFVSGAKWEQEEIGKLLDGGCDD